MKKPTFISLINRAHTLLATTAIVLLASCSKAELQQENNAEPPKSSSIYAVSYNEAMAELESLLSDINTPTKGKTPRKVANYYTTTLSGAETKSNTDDPFIYIFNFENNEGFAILSGDKRTTPVYAITESGSLNPGDTITNPGLGIALMGINDDIWGTIDKDPPGDNIVDIISDATEVSRTPILIPCRWGQGKPYNGYCPSFWHSGEGKYINYKTGCVATAIAQIMYYHGYPSYYNGHSFDWNIMRRQIGQAYGEDHEPAHNMVSRLMQQLGLSQNLNMDYRSDASWAYDEDVARTFRNFGYSSGGTLKTYNENELISEIKAGYPVYLSGSAYKTTNIFGILISYSGGHAWISDRVMKRSWTTTRYRNGIFDSQWTTEHYLIYCNWGEDNSDKVPNGYFYSGLFNQNSDPVTRATEGEAGNYRFNLKMITGIRR